MMYLPVVKFLVALATGGAQVGELGIVTVSSTGVSPAGALAFRLIT